MSFRCGLCSDVGNWAQAAVVPHPVLQLTDSPLWVGAAGAAPLLAQVLATLVGGRFADSVSRMGLLLRADVAMLTVAAQLAAMVSAGWGGAPAIVVGATVLALVDRVRRRFPAALRRPACGPDDAVEVRVASVFAPATLRRGGSVDEVYPQPPALRMPVRWKRDRTMKPQAC